MPLAFADERDYVRFEQGDLVQMVGIRAALERGEETVTVENVTRGARVQARLELGDRARRTLLAGGLLNLVRATGAGGAAAASETPTAVATPASKLGRETA